MFRHQKVGIQIIAILFVYCLHFAEAGGIDVTGQLSSNPAKLLGVKGNKILVEQSDPFGLGDKENKFFFIWNTDKGGAGLEIGTFQAFDYDYREQKYTLSLGKKINPNLGVGIGVSLESIHSLENARGSFYNVGILYQRGGLETGIAYSHFGRFNWSTKTKQRDSGNLHTTLKIKQSDKLSYIFSHSFSSARKITAAVEWMLISGLKLQVESGAQGLRFGLNLSTRNISVKYLLEQSDLGIGGKLALGILL